MSGAASARRVREWLMVRKFVVRRPGLAAGVTQATCLDLIPRAIPVITKPRMVQRRRGFQAKSRRVAARFGWLFSRQTAIAVFRALAGCRGPWPVRIGRRPRETSHPGRDATDFRSSSALAHRPRSARPMLDPATARSCHRPSRAWSSVRPFRDRPADDGERGERLGGRSTSRASPKWVLCAAVVSMARC
jgi:hypothetical protein